MQRLHSFFAEFHLELLHCNFFFFKVFSIQSSPNPLENRLSGDTWKWLENFIPQYKTQTLHRIYKEINIHIFSTPFQAMVGLQ